MWWLGGFGRAGALWKYGAGSYSAVYDYYLVSLFSPSIFMLFALMFLFGWMGLVGWCSDRVLRAHMFDYVRARSLERYQTDQNYIGISSCQMHWHQACHNCILF